jgi:hypothetical protein
MGIVAAKRVPRRPGVAVMAFGGGIDYPTLAESKETVAGRTCRD